MPELDLGSVIGPQGPKGDKGIDGAVGPMGPQGEKGDDGAAASINGVNALTMTTGDGLEATMNGSAYHLKLTDNALNAVQAVGTFVRPNLLDNWYFGNPVDQKKGMLQLAGTMLYSDAACTQALFQSTKTTSIIKVSDIAAHPSDDSTVYVKLADCVRGYTGNGYTVDRWGILNNVTATLQNASLNIAYTESGWNLYTFLDNVLMPGTTYTLSCLYKASGNPIRLVCTWGTNKFFYNEQAPISDDWTLAEITGTIPADATIDINDIVVQSLGSGAGNFSLKAIKLELGSTQTLAHREGDKWVTNEVPEYGDQLRRCQRYAIKIGKDTAGDSSLVGFALCTSSNLASAFISLPVSMRTKPIVTFKNVYLSLGSSVVAVTNITVYENTQNGIYCALSVSGGLTVGQTVAIRTSDGGYIMPSADL